MAATRAAQVAARLDSVWCLAARVHSQTRAAAWACIPLQTMLCWLNLYPCRDDLASFMFTSGTTGKPKVG